MATHFFDDDFGPSHLVSLSHKTPYFLFRKKKILEKYDQFKTFFPQASIHYAIKANSEIPLLEILHEAGASFEIASIYELKILQTVGVPSEKIIYGTSVKPISHIKEAFECGVDRFAVDSFAELEKVAAVAPGSRIFVRMIINDTGSVFRFSEKFGAETEHVVPLLVRARELGLIPYGISFHVGSQATDVHAWSEALKKIGDIMENLKSQGITIDIINMGGGFPAAYLTSEMSPSLEEIAEHVMSTHEQLPFKPSLVLEPGRGIVAETGILVATVIARVERKGNNWLFLDAGVYNGLFETMAYQGSTRYPITSMRPVLDSGESLFALAGPTGDGPDVITREALLPQDSDVGDKIIIHNVGAYSLVVTSSFNGFPKPDVYFI